VLVVCEETAWTMTTAAAGTVVLLCDSHGVWCTYHEKTCSGRVGVSAASGQESDVCGERDGAL
jgi:hypothetical protein